ncbi:hypothetical protein C9890_0631 [Perkinsus sp. BL_2016]|nr:hypothetical protein C9890_0631 [Perkinsus sp. BL_2016]
MSNLKDFLIKTLLSYNCEADLEVLSDYILALIGNEANPSSSELNGQLQVFLHDSTDDFVQELTEFIGKESNIVPSEGSVFLSSASVNEEVEIDYEEEESPEPMIISAPALPQRQRILREYSPERRSPPPPSKDEVITKQQCTNFGKYGNCRFGDNCRYAHIIVPPAQRRRNVSSRVKLSNLPPSQVSPAVLTEIMKKYGSVVSVTVYPEKGEGIVQYASGEEASLAIEGAVNDFEADDRVVIELETITFTKTAAIPFRKQPIFPAIPPEPFSKPVHALRRKKAASADNERKSIVNEKKLAYERAPFDKRVNYHYPQNYNYNNNNNSNSNSNSYIPAHHNHNTYAPVPRGYNNVYIPHSGSYNISSGGYNNNTYSPATARPNLTNKNSLDLRPTTLKLGPLNLTSCPDMRSLQTRFSPYGLIQSLILVDGGQTAIIKYQKHGDAVKAFEGSRKEFEGIDSLEFSVVKP